MKYYLLILLQIGWVFLHAQSFNGHWKGVILRDFENETRRDSITLELEQNGNKITGFSFLQVDSIHFIKAAITGEYNASIQLLRLTETSVVELNIPDRGEEIFLDRYLLNIGEVERNELSGKSVPCDNKHKYARSKMMLQRQ